MNKAIVRCRCGHQVLAKEVLRTDLYERSSGREYIYLKYRCARCKRLGQSFVPEAKWDWGALEPAHNELSEAERDRFLDEAPISAVELLDFHAQLKTIASPRELSVMNESSQDRAQKEERERNEREHPKGRFENGRAEGGRLRGRHEGGERANDRPTDPPRLPYPNTNGDSDENNTNS